MTSGWDLCHVGTSKLIWKTNRWNGPCTKRFLPEGRAEQTVMLHLCGSGGGVERFLERSLMCWVITALGCVFHFGTSEIK